MRLAVLTCAAALLAGCATPNSAHVAAAALLEADWAFASDAETHGVHAAFAEALAGDAVLFRPEPVRAHEWLDKHPDWSDRIAWQPDLAEAAASADFGVTSGTWSVQSAPGAPVTAQGRYVTVWRLREDRWQVVLDHGVSLPPEDAQPREPQLRAPSGELPAALQATPAQAKTVDLFFAKSLAAGDSGLESLLAPDVEFLREDLLLEGRAEAEMAYAALLGGSSSCAGAVIAHDGTMSATWGTAETAGKRFAYVRVWRTNSSDSLSRVALDLLVPLP